MADRLSSWTFRLGVAALVISLAGALLARFEIIPKLSGLTGLLAGAALAGIGTIIGLVALLLSFRSKGSKMRLLLVGLLLSGGHFGFMASRAAVASGVPAIHDITTDLQNPPQFVKLKIGADNLRGVDTVEKWRQLHAAAYSNINPLYIKKAPDAVFADVEKLAIAQGWEIALDDPKARRLEATASVSLIGYQDDVVVLVTTDPSGQTSIVHMRSVSRVGMSDLGVNAKRIKAFLAALSG